MQTVSRSAFGNNAANYQPGSTLPSISTSYDSMVSWIAPATSPNRASIPASYKFRETATVRRKLDLRKYKFGDTHPDTSICSRFHSLKKFLISMVERQCKCRITYSAFDLHTDIDLQDIAVLKYYRTYSWRKFLSVRVERTFGITAIRCIMSSTMIQTEACGEADTAFQTVLFNDSTNPVLDKIRNFDHLHPRTDSFSCILSYLSMYFCSSSDVVIGNSRVIQDFSFHISFFFGGRPPCIANKVNTTWVTFILSSEHVTHSSLYGWSSPSGKLPSGNNLVRPTLGGSLWVAFFFLGFFFFFFFLLASPKRHRKAHTVGVKIEWFNNPIGGRENPPQMIEPR